MPRSILLVSLVALGCTAIEADIGVPSAGAGGTDPSVGGSDGSGPGGGDGTDAGSDGTEPEPELTLASGIWSPLGLGVEADPCDWNETMGSFGLSIEAFLPSEFEVVAEEGQFTIEALSYGARGPIDCTITGDEFSCEQQRVSPLAYDLGAYGWEYAIDFNGQAPSERVLQGTAVVSFPSVDRQSAGWFDYYGIDISECTQVYSLELGVEG